MRRTIFTAIGVLAIAGVSGCSFGLRYDGDEAGLHRESHAVPGREDRVLSYLASGDVTEPRLIFVHGSPGRAAGYTDYLQDPLDGFETVAVDRLGYGESRASGAVVSFEEQARAIEPLLEVRDGIWPIVVGHSLGGPIACRLAADNPGRVGGLIIVGAALDPSLEQPQWYNRAAAVPPVNVSLHQKLQVSNKEMFAARGQLELLEPLLPSISCPVIIIHGTRDSLVHYDNVGFMLRQFEGNEHVKLITMWGEDHFITRERAEEVREAIREMRALLEELR
jgi:pimeloyl-ACP methyl ester carboxylesterase